MFIVTKASNNEVLTIFKEDKLRKLLIGAPSLEELECLLLTNDYGYRILTYKQYELLFQVYPVKGFEGVLEGHLMCPFSSRVASKVLTLMCISWIFNTYAPNSKVLMTKVLKGHLANFASSLGLIRGKEVGEFVYFFATRSQLNLTK